MIAGRYTLVREVGRGGMGAVWLARDEVLGREVALKRVGFGIGGTAPDLDRAEREARLAARLNHPHVVAVFDLATEGDDRWLVMEYVEGATLAELVRRGGPLSPDAAAPLLRQAADALAAAHGAGIVHRDVKPSNMLVTPDGQVKLSDFGIARAQADASLTQTGLVTGSPAYLAPEVASGQQATAASDVWSLGATLHHALAGHPPYEVGDNVLGALYRIVHEDPPELGAAAGWLAPVLHATMIHPVDRRWSTAQVRDFLDAGPSGVGLPPAPVAVPAAPVRPEPQEHTQVMSVASPPPPMAAAPRRRRSPLPLLVVALAVAAVAAVAIVWLSGRGEDPGASGGPTRSPSQSTSPPSPTAKATADGMETFIEDYLATVTSDPRSAWDQLTPEFQNESGSFGQYQKFWRTISSAEVQSAQADPASKTITYTVEYQLADGSSTTDHVTLQLEGTDGDYRIAAES